MQAKFTAVGAFTRDAKLKAALAHIRQATKANNAIAWLESSKAIDLLFKVEDLGSSHGGTRIWIGGVEDGFNLNTTKMFKKESLVPALLNAGNTKVEIEICVDSTTIESASQQEIEVILAHEIGTHVAPLVTFLQHLTGSHGVTLEDIASILPESTEHAAIATLKNTTYLQLVVSIMELTPQEGDKETLFATFLGEMSRYDFLGNTIQDEELIKLNAQRTLNRLGSKSNLVTDVQRLPRLMKHHVYISSLAAITVIGVLLFLISLRMFI
ncbi:MAG TPA: hypothetical protein VHC97_08085 [Thermoanaerobaculia bacterium]|nr:hypothetical protein [Thermoanaerobaculia bacterium]